MSEDYRWARTEERLRDLEQIARNVPVIQRDIAEIKVDVIEVRDENRSMRRAFYSLALSIVSASVIALITVDKIFA